MHLGGEFKSVAVGTESRQETRRQNGAGAGKTAKQGDRHVGQTELRFADRIVQSIRSRRNLRDERLNHHRRSQQDRSIVGQGLSSDVAEQLVELVLSR